MAVMFSKLMCRFGIGATKIDLVLNKKEFRPGDVIKGEYELTGGRVEQKLKRIETDLLQYNHSIDRSSVLHQNTILSSSTMKANEQRSIHFSCRLSDTFPPSSETLSYKFVTRLVFDDGVNSVDHDEFQILI
ncbi:sporulation protein [Rossellomorea sp. YZS02]|uniref:sporulation protein n=1 Tax=Rossellomorea sp. YZS02 TaxID=3097358 RepID=UPI002A15C01A|nr:sporulation protein [Rossellomorea sp. YZS02]MDX8345634.1 sporulation protein [Rossellomorea sp. YZS02]